MYIYFLRKSGMTLFNDHQDFLNRHDKNPRLQEGPCHEEPTQSWIEPPLKQNIGRYLQKWSNNWV